MQRIFLLVIIGVGLLTLPIHPAEASTDKRVAFVVGNSAYQNAPALANPRNDAVAMSEELRALGFLTIDGLDLTANQFRDKIREFVQLSADADVALFFYAGHGLAVNGTNYLVPVDAKFEDVTALDFEAVSVDFITRQMGYSGGVSLLFLDACRNNPLAANLSRAMENRSRSVAVSTGLAEMKIENPGEGLAIAFATSPGEVAYDGNGAHSPFTSALLNNIGAANTDITEIMSKVTGEVYASTDKAQRPWLNTSLTGSVVLNPVATAPAVAGNSAQAAPSTGNDGQNTLELDKTVFQMARDSDRIEDYRAYLDTFPNGVFANFARRSIARLEKAESEAATEPDQQVASLTTPDAGTAPETDQQRSLDTNAQGSQTYQLTPEQRAMPSNRATEQFLAGDWMKRREVQARLNLTGNNVGRADGAFGRKTRAGIQNWQIGNGFVPTGYLNQPQYLYLVSQTQDAYSVWIVSNPARQPHRSKPRSKPDNSGVGAFLGGLAAGIIIGH